MKNKLTQIKNSLPVLIPSGITYILSSYGVANTTGVLKSLLYIVFLASFAVFGGFILNLLDLKYIGKGFIE